MVCRASTRQVKMIRFVRISLGVLVHSNGSVFNWREEFCTGRRWTVKAPYGQWYSLWWKIREHTKIVIL